MFTIRIPEAEWAKTYAHLFATPGEHFAFFLAKWTWSVEEPVFMVRKVILVPDASVQVTRTGWVMSNDALTAVINRAVLSGCALIEIHNHGGVYPRFSRTDRAGFREIVPYMLDSLRGRPYAATVWGDDTVYGEHFAPDGRIGIVTSVAVVGSKLDQVVSLNDDEQPIAQRFDRQAPWFERPRSTALKQAYIRVRWRRRHRQPGSPEPSVPWG